MSCAASDGSWTAVLPIFLARLAEYSSALRKRFVVLADADDASPSALSAITSLQTDIDIAHRLHYFLMSPPPVTDLPGGFVPALIAHTTPAAPESASLAATACDGAVPAADAGAAGADDAALTSDSPSTDTFRGVVEDLSGILWPPEAAAGLGMGGADTAGAGATSPKL
eukprot:TRINITY_DN46600_c0_g1_i1.p2 TRINITY_DN46600_c0_g1~~TRINITY_DN46600_c0_g1_i1.p2  ORF type:complete len:169 (+),score=27.42 TRINITY_DN46600_c0_g1_i1:100-606(+)